MTTPDHRHAPDRAAPTVSVVGAGQGRLIQAGGLRLHVKEDGSRTRGTLAVVEFSADGAFHSPPAHVHHEHEEGFYVLEGEVEFTIGPETIRAAAGTWVLVPIGVPHTFHNAQEAPMRFLCTLSPDFYLRYFDEVAALFADGPPDPFAVAELRQRYATDQL